MAYNSGIIYFEFVKGTINAEKYCDQLQQVQDAMRENRPQRQENEEGQKQPTLFLHDNARPHTARTTQEKLRELGWEVIPHPPYSPDLSPTDYKAFRSLQNFLAGKEFHNDDEVQEAVGTWITERSSGFFVRGITDLPQRWRKTIEREGDYFPESEIQPN